MKENLHLIPGCSSQLNEMRNVMGDAFLNRTASRPAADIIPSLVLHRTDSGISCCSVMICRVPRLQGIECIQTSHHNLLVRWQSWTAVAVRHC